MSDPSWPKGAHLGEFPQLVLLTVLSLGDQAWITTIRRSIEDQRQRPASHSGVYAVLSKLENNGLLQVHLGRKTQGKGRRHHVYSLTQLGLEHVNKIGSIFQQAAVSTPQVLGAQLLTESAQEPQNQRQLVQNG